MTKRKFFRRIYVVEVLSESHIEEELDVVLKMCSDGPYSGDIKSDEETEVDGAEMAKLLTAQRSDPGFFNLTEDGGDLESDDV